MILVGGPVGDSITLSYVGSPYGQTFDSSAEPTQITLPSVGSSTLTIT